ncbi:TadE/TadG family type IV pilus assembly protein [Mesorhizobium sp. INR15]|uniref:TadE/TadG family type IV pilus assembly protein n=1 Tax=Mesorhizobium sp. INR15 TaxID=2654248 RepID=UPI0018965983|nr:TadE/TadG family type IV pilus assembly protein [Mesorhizobium sp. INR15]QPC94941.1 pilus assembly protein [Mesorhizobium sp. INR15]
MNRKFGSHDDQAAGPAGFFARFLRDKKGSTALEFALLALPFALLVFAILESCISFAGQEVMANVTDDIARQLRTGQIRQADATPDKLGPLICGKLIIVPTDCTTSLVVDLHEYQTFADAATASFTITNKALVISQGTNAQDFSGKPEARNMLRVFYKWPVMTDFMAASMANLAGGKTLHFASVTWQAEPYNN